MGKGTPNNFLQPLQALDDTLGKLLKEPSAAEHWTDLKNAQNHVRNMIIKPDKITLEQLDISLANLKQPYPDLSEGLVIFRTSKAGSEVLRTTKETSVATRTSKEDPEVPT